MIWFKRESKEVQRLEKRVQELLVNQAQLLEQARSAGRARQFAKVGNIETLILDLPLPREIAWRLCDEVRLAVEKQFEEAPEFRR
ncbi:hypothetical protein [Methylocystis heyeri]|uniref:hypothetical protein n=1 Tax=Methylocystis heyeri TaxID=391905 RepID=UPI00113A1CE6|nr:hypothetical protein [Methylocystis heyeri]